MVVYYWLLAPSETANGQRTSFFFTACSRKSLDPQLHFVVPDGSHRSRARGPMVVLRLHFQVTGHKLPILAAGAHGDFLVTAEQGSIRLWSFTSAHAAWGGPALLGLATCPRQSIRALFIPPGGSQVVGVFEEDGVLLFDVGGDIEERRVLRHFGGEKGKGKVLAAAWNADTFSLAIATAAGGVQIYELVLAPSKNSFDKAIGEGTHATSAFQPPPTALILKHEIVIKILSLTPSGGKKLSSSQVGSLTTDESSDTEKGGAGTLVGVADGQHLCVWDFVTGSTLITALAIAPEGCKVEKVAWYSSTALAALLYSLKDGLKRVDVHQIDVARQTTSPLLSYTSDVLIAGIFLSAVPDIGAYVSPPSTSHRPPNGVYLHVIDRLRTLRTWIFNSSGVNAVVAYSLPEAAPRVPLAPSNAVDCAHIGEIGPESHGKTLSDEEEGIECEKMTSGIKEGEQQGVNKKNRRKWRRQRHLAEIPINRQEKEDEEVVDAINLARGASIATVIPTGRHSKGAVDILVVAGVALSGISFLPEGGGWQQTEGGSGPIWKVPEASEGSDCAGSRQVKNTPRVLGMRGVVSESGAQQALALVWAERPSFQVLDVGHADSIGMVQNISLGRRHREDQLATVPRSDRPCFLTCWGHSTVLGTLICGWNDGTVDIISPCVSRRRSQLLQSGGTCVPVTALGLIPLSVLLSCLGNQFLPDSEGFSFDRDGGGVTALVGSADGTLALWPMRRAFRPWNVILAHTDAIVAIRTVMDAPQDAREGWSSVPSPGRTNGDRDGSGNGREGSERANDDTNVGRGHGWKRQNHHSRFFVVTAGANREIKVWSIDTAEREVASLLALEGYTVVGHNISCNSQLSTVELLSEKSIACGFSMGDVEVWAIPFKSRRGVLATTREAVQVFPLAHEAEVTSIAVSFGMRFCLEGGGGENVGRVVLTTSVDRTIVRWASMAPGDRIFPMIRYCLSVEPAAAVLLPPLLPSAGRTATPHPQNKCGKGDLNTVGTSKGVFRVVAALESVITVLELANAKTLMGEGEKSRGIGIAIKNAFPGTPFVPQLPPEKVPEQEGDNRGFRWTVGGPNGGKAGRYEVLGGIKHLSQEWEISGTNRVAAAFASRKTRRVQAGSYEEKGAPISCKRLKPRHEDSKRQGDSGAQSVGKLLTRRPLMAKPSVTTLTVDPGKYSSIKNKALHHRRSDRGFNTIPESTYRKTNGGKTIKMDTGFVAALLERLLPPEPIDRKELLRQPSMHSIELTMSANNSCNSYTTAAGNGSTIGLSVDEKFTADNSIEETVNTASRVGDGRDGSHNYGDEGAGLAGLRRETLEEEITTETKELEINNKKKKTSAMNTAVAAISAARSAREAHKMRGMLAMPVVVGRQEAEHGSRQPFNYDFAQAPSHGMLGVGVAVPKGYADARLRASKRAFTPAALSRKTVRHNHIGRKKRANTTEAGGAMTVVTGARKSETETGVIVEAFPTGLVVSRHFRETSTGREILMLEIEKVADRRHISTASAGDQSRTASDLERIKQCGAEYTGDEDVDAAATAAAAELAALSPRSRCLRDIFQTLSTGRDFLTQEALGKWSYISKSIERGLISQYQVKSLFRQAHGGRHRGKMIWRDIINFYEEMEAVLDKACPPPQAEEFGIDSVEWDTISASLFLTTRGDVYVIAVEAKDGDNRPPSPATIRNSGDGDGGTHIGNTTRTVAAWAMATVTNPDVPARLILYGLLPERGYELYAYAENGEGRRGGYKNGDLSLLFSVEPGPSEMSSAMVAATCLYAKTAREPDEELDVPWECLSEAEKMAEALAALSDPVVSRAARESALDPPTAEDIIRCETDLVSRNRWRSFCRWWTAEGAGGAERAAFLLRECIFAAQQSEILEEAAMMGVQLIEGDWNATADLNTAPSTIPTTTSVSAQQRRWTAFRSWYRGGRVFDRADDSLIVAAMLRQPPSPGSQGRPLTPRIAPADRPQPTAPTKIETRTKGEGMASSTFLSEYQAASMSLATEARPMTGTSAILAVAATAPVTPMDVVCRRTTPPAPPSPPKSVTSVTTLKAKDGSAWPKLSKCGSGSSSVGNTTAEGGRGASSEYGTEAAKGNIDMTQDASKEANNLSEITPFATGGLEHLANEAVDAAGLASIARWEEGIEHFELKDEDRSESIAHGVPPFSRDSGTTTAKRLRMEARRKFLAARTVSSKAAASKVGRLLDIKREDVKSKRTAATASGVVARRGRAAASKKRRRSQVERALALKRADELLEKSGKAKHIQQRRGSLETLRPEDVAQIGVFDHFKVEEFDPEEVDPDLFRSQSATSIETDSMDFLAQEFISWIPRSPEELTLELQLACVHSRVCMLAAVARIGVPDPEDSFLMLFLPHKKARWEAFATWYFPPGHESILPQRRALLDGEVLEAMKDKTTQISMQEEGLFDLQNKCNESDFIDWYCEEEAVPRQKFRRLRVEELLQSRRLVATQVLAYVPTPYLFREIPRSIPPPLPPIVVRFRLFPSRSPEAFSWVDIAKWYGQEIFDNEDEALRAGERAGLRTALLDAAQAEETDSQGLERRVAQWEDLRSELMRQAERELTGDPFRVGEGEWQYSATLQSWRELKYLGFDTGSGLENKDEVLDALEVARKEAQEERGRVAEIRRQQAIAKQNKLDEERRRREEEERLRWMRETEERRCLVQQHMANLKRQRMLDTERGLMAREEALTLDLMREEKRLFQLQHAREALEAEECRVRDLALAAASAAMIETQRRIHAEITIMILEDERSREVESETRAAELVLKKQEEYLRDLYTPFVPLWGGVQNMGPEEEKEETSGGWGKEERPTIWWKGADARQIWVGPNEPWRRVPRFRPGSRFVPHARALLDGLEPQSVCLGKLSRKYLALLGLSHEAILEMYKKGKWTVKDGDAMVDGIQLGRVFTMYEEEKVRNHLVPVVPLERLGTRESSRGGTIHPPERQRRSQALGFGESRRFRSCRVLGAKGLVPSTFQTEEKLCFSTQRGVCTAGSLRRFGGGSGRDSSGWPGQGWGRHIVRTGAESIAGLPLSGDERSDVTTPESRHPITARIHQISEESQYQTKGRSRHPEPLPQPAFGVEPTQAAIALTAKSKVARGKSHGVARFISATSPFRSPEEIPYNANPLKVEEAQSQPQWGGFGPGHVPRFFRGKFGIAGEKKRIIVRERDGGGDGGSSGGSSNSDGGGGSSGGGHCVGVALDSWEVDETVVEYLPEITFGDITGDGSINAFDIDRTGNDSACTFLAEPSTVGLEQSLLSSSRQELNSISVPVPLVET